jgi:molybdate transport system substrate-binding protein
MRKHGLCIQAGIDCLPFTDKEQDMNARAAELQIIAGGAIAAPLTALAARFENASGHKLAVRFGTTPELIEMATAGGPFDLGVVPREVLKDAGARSRFASAPTMDIARAGLGVAVRAGAPKPDISTPQAFKQALLNAHSIATIPASAAGYQALRAFEALGIGEAMQAKIKVQKAPPQIVEAVAKGEAQLGIFLMNVLVMACGLDVAGPFPAGLQQDVVFTAGIAANPRQAQAAQAFIDYLKTPDAAALLKAMGMNPA